MTLFERVRRSYRDLIGSGMNSYISSYVGVLNTKQQQKQRWNSSRGASKQNSRVFMVRTVQQRRRCRLWLRACSAKEDVKQVCWLSWESWCFWRGTCPCRSCIVSVHTIMVLENELLVAWIAPSTWYLIIRTIVEPRRLSRHRLFSVGESKQITMPLPLYLSAL